MRVASCKTLAWEFRSQVDEEGRLALMGKSSLTIRQGISRCASRPRRARPCAPRFGCEWKWHARARGLRLAPLLVLGVHNRRQLLELHVPELVGMLHDILPGVLAAPALAEPRDGAHSGRPLGLARRELHRQPRPERRLLPVAAVAAGAAGGRRGDHPRSAQHPTAASHPTASSAPPTGPASLAVCWGGLSRLGASAAPSRRAWKPARRACAPCDGVLPGRPTAGRRCSSPPFGR